MDIIEAAFEHNATEIDVVSAALGASHAKNQRRLNRLLRKHPDITKEVEKDLQHQVLFKSGGLQQEIPVRLRRNNRPQRPVHWREA